MLCMFCNDFQVFFRYVLKVFQMHVLNVSSVFVCMLQVLHMDVSKVDWVLHMMQCDTLAAALVPVARAPSWSLCGHLRLANASVACIHTRGEAGPLLSITPLRGYGLASITRTGRGTLLLRGDRTGHVGCARREQRPDASCN
jgi:hypothetical protein